jgi:hypothetical protein
MTAASMTRAEATQIVATWSKGKRRFNEVRQLMGFLAHDDIAAAARGSKTKTGFIRGPNDWDLDALYRAAIAAHSCTQGTEASKGRRAFSVNGTERA